MTGNDWSSRASTPSTPRRIVMAALALGLLAVAVAAYAVISSVSLSMNPDPMLGLELAVAAMLLVVAAGLGAVSIGLLHAVSWARPWAIGAALLLVLGGVAMPFMAPRSMAASAWPLDPFGAGLAAMGAMLAVLLAKPYPRR